MGLPWITHSFLSCMGHSWAVRESSMGLLGSTTRHPWVKCHVWVQCRPMGPPFVFYGLLPYREHVIFLSQNTTAVLSQLHVQLFQIVTLCPRFNRG